MFCKEDIIAEPEINPYKYHYSLIEPYRKFKPKIKYRHITQQSVYNVMDVLDNARSIKSLKNSIDSFVDRSQHYSALSRDSVTKAKSEILPFVDKLYKNKTEKNMQEKSLLYQCLTQKPTRVSDEKNTTNLFDRKICVKEEIEIENESSIDWAEISLKNITSSFSKQIFDNFGLNFFEKENNSIMTLSLKDVHGCRQVSFNFDSKLLHKSDKHKQAESETKKNN